MPATSLDLEKRALRTAMRARLAAANPSAANAAAAVAAAILSSAPFRGADRIALYASFRDELPTRSLFDAVIASGKIALFPRCVGETLEFAAVESWDGLVDGAFGTLEPSASEIAQPLLPSDLALVPGLAFDRRGGRLGRGRGFYDRTFGSGAVPFLCGLAYAAQIVERVPMGRYDVQMDAIATEDGWAFLTSETANESGGA